MVRVLADQLKNCRGPRLRYRRVRCFPGGRACMPFFPRHAVPVIANAEVQRQIGTDFPIVLEKPPHSFWWYSLIRICGENVVSVGLQCIECKTSNVRYGAGKIQQEVLRGCDAGPESPGSSDAGHRCRS